MGLASEQQFQTLKVSCVASISMVLFPVLQLCVLEQAAYCSHYNSQ